MKLAGIVGSAARSGRTRLAVELVAAGAAQRLPDLQIDVIDLAETKLSFADGRAPEALTDDTAAVLQRVGAADLIVIGTPVYRGSYTGALKNLLDLLPLEALQAKPVALVAAGASPHHYLAIDAALRPVLAWFNAYQLPGSVYLQGADYADGRIVNELVRQDLNELGGSLAELGLRLAGLAALPKPLAARAKG